MRRRHYLSLLLLGALTAGATAAFQSSPGYMDADYYFMGAGRLMDGHGFTEEILWNYLDEPSGVPHPSHSYWMPLASLVAAAGAWLAGGASFAAGRLPFVALAALVPPLTALLAYRLTAERIHGLLAGVLGAFPSFYLPFLTTTDTFGIYMVLGAAYLIVLGSPASGSSQGREALRALALGVLAGLMHLARADGLLWVVVGWLGVALRSGLFRDRAQFRGRLTSALTLSLAVTAGYGLVMGPWLARNISVFGSPFAPGGVRALYLTSYDELFTFPASELTAARWWGQGIGAIFAPRLQALGTNLGSLLAVQGQIFLFPLILLGAWSLREDLRVQAGLAAWVLTFVGMTVAFPFPGARGGFFHSGAALQPLFWALAPVGLDELIRWGTRRRGWKPAQARLVFSAGLIAFAVALTWTSLSRRVAGGDFGNPSWDASARVYDALEATLVEVGAAPDEIVMVNNPPGYFLSSKRPAIVIPNGDVQALLSAADRYRASYVLLEPNHPAALQPLYSAPESEPRLELLRTVDGSHILRILRVTGRSGFPGQPGSWGLGLKTGSWPT